ncbi:MAG TPA: Omp28-related outer membrane protein [Chitinophagaceae bacterium]|nr:Omp28-related outer membrane protein [Chitinophagaceae bacterium]
MKKWQLLFALPFFLYACKEQAIGIQFEDKEMVDTSYVTNIETPEEKKYLLEELTGVRCVNCPQGAEALEQLNSENNNSFVIVAHHFGSLTSPINGKSIQDFRTSQGSQIMDLIFGGQGNKPSVSFDRLPLSTGFNPYFIDGMSNWPAAIQQMKDYANTSPVNIKIETREEGENAYNIYTKLAFTENLDFPVNLHIYAVENNIWDGFIGSDTLIKYDHVFREAITGAGGKEILRDLNAIEAGRVYELNTKFNWDKNDEKQSYWKAEEMQIVVFASRKEIDNQEILQAAAISLK